MEIRVDVPDGKSGDWSVESFTISEKDIALENMKMSFQPGMGGRILKPGTYKRLCRNGKCIMSNTHAEIGDHFEFIR
jgi:hypothetical protein